MTNFVDTVFNTSATGNVIKYNLKHADNTTEQVQLSVATPITTQGTALNKAFFDTIQTDLNNKLAISSKASQSEAETGTNDTKYMTPLKVKQEALKILETQKVIEYKKTSAEGTAGIDLSTYLTSDTVKLEIYINGIHSTSSNTSSVTLTGTHLKDQSTATGDMSRNTHSSYTSLTLASNVRSIRLHLEIVKTIGTVYLDGLNNSGSTEAINKTIGFDTITQITTPSFNDNVSGYYNLPYPITIIQYKK